MNKFLFILIILAINTLLPEKNSNKKSDKTEKVRQLYARLLQTIGSPTDAPVLRVLPKSTSKKNGYVVYRPGNPGRIEMSEAVLDLCLTFGRDADAALACLLGHELAHFQYRHGGKQGFFSPVVMPNGSPNSSTNLEALADKSGVFMAYLAGYDAFRLAPEVYRAFYDTFKIDQLPGYPTKAQRLRMVADTTDRVQELAQLFEIGEISYLMHDYESASQVFTALVSRYPTAVTLNNLGVIKLNQALLRMKSARNDPRLGFMFPIEFDADNRLLASTRRDELLPYLELLTDARHLFQTALADQPSHQSARLNEAITCYLLEQSDKARQLLLAKQPLTPNAGLMLAIVQTDLGQTQQARGGFQQAISRGAFRAMDNARLFDASQKPGWVTYFNQMIARKQISQTPKKPVFNLPDLSIPTLTWQSLPIPGKARYALTDSLVGYELSLDVNNQRRVYRVIKSHQWPLKGLPWGSPRSLMAVYAPPTAMIAGAKGSLFYEYQQEMRRLFLEYRQDRLIGWTYVTT